MNEDLNRACFALQDFYAILKEMVAEGELTEEEIVEEFGYNLRQLEDALAEVHHVRTTR